MCRKHCDKTGAWWELARWKLRKRRL